MYVAGHKNANAAITALKINYAVREIIQPAKEERYLPRRWLHDNGAADRVAERSR